MAASCRARGACTLIFFLVVGLAAQCRVLEAQCGASVPASPLHTSYLQHDWNGVVAAAAARFALSAGENYDYGMALAHLGRWPEARNVLLAGHRQCPRDERFPVELAGVAFQTKDYPQTSAWLQRALRLAPHDEYATNFAATVYFLMGNLDAALKYWNRLHKPYIANLIFDPNLRLHRQVLDRAFVFAPASTLERSQYAATDARLRSLDLFPAYHIELSARPDGNFDARFNALERDGFGSTRVQALLSTFGGVFYETIYPSYFNLNRSAINIESLLRWDTQKRRAWMSVSGPLHALPQWRWQFTADLRNENWIVRRSFTGPAPALGSLNLEREVVAGTISGLPRGTLQWTTGAELSHRTFRSVSYGNALNDALVSPGFAIKHLASVRDTLVDITEHRFTLDAAGSSEFTRLWSSPPRLYEKLQGSAIAHWFPQATGDRYEARQQLRAGRTFGTPPFDELFMLGVERDNDLWLRGLIGTRDGRKGCAPLGSSYVLSNSDFDRRLYTNGLISIKAGPWLDLGRAYAPNTALSPRQWLVSAGIQARVSVLGTGVILTWGRDLRNGTNAFFGTLAGQ